MRYLKCTKLPATGIFFIIYNLNQEEVLCLKFHTHIKYNKYNFYENQVAGGPCSVRRA